MKLPTFRSFLFAIVALIILFALAKDEPSPKYRAVVSYSAPSNCSSPVSRDWIDKINNIRWIAYSSPNPSIDKGYYQPTADDIYQELAALRKANFTGLITYGSTGIMGKQFISIAQSLGFKGIILGIWSPTNQIELNIAKNAASSPIVLGYGIGNEGLSGGGKDQYSMSELCSAIFDLRTSTGKPVATSEDVETYYWRPELFSIGDWMFPIVHPYWHFTKYARDAIEWEQIEYTNLLARTNLFVFFKEVGLPTDGASGLSEANQDLYYRGLAQTDVRFAYFEAFDQPSKNYAAVEPHWGIFNADLSPKLLAWNLMGYQLFTSSNTSSNPLVVFNTSNLPDNAVITSVKLKIRSTDISGANSLNDQNVLTADICKLPEYKRVRYQTIEFKAGLICDDNVGTFSAISDDGWYTADLSPTAFPSISLTNTTWFRLRISGIERAVQDLNGPALQVNYSVPNPK